jgi:glycosyltransferase involved in cell wall biosynthesis
MIPNPVEIHGPLELSRCDNETSNRIIRIIFASRFIMEKGGAEFVNAIGKIKINKKWIAEMYGDGHERIFLESRIKELELEDKVFLRGHVTLENLLKVYSESDIFVFPSMHSEGFPMAFFFALASGMAIITSRAAPIPDYLSEPDNCIFIDPKDTVSFVASIERLISEDMLRSEMKKNNVEVAALFSPKRIASLFMELYAKFA